MVKHPIVYCSKEKRGASLIWVKIWKFFRFYIKHFLLSVMLAIGLYIPYLCEGSFLLHILFSYICIKICWILSSNFLILLNSYYFMHCYARMVFNDYFIPGIRITWLWVINSKSNLLVFCRKNIFLAVFKNSTSSFLLFCILFLVWDWN